MISLKYLRLQKSEKMILHCKTKKVLNPQ